MLLIFLVENLMSWSQQTLRTYTNTAYLPSLVVQSVTSSESHHVLDFIKTYFFLLIWATSDNTNNEQKHLSSQELLFLDKKKRKKSKDSVMKSNIVLR